MLENPVEIAYLLAPAASGYAASMVCGVDGENAGDCIPWRPPGYVFGIVWPILYLLIGISMIFASRIVTSPMVVFTYSVLVLLLAAWPIVYTCVGNKKAGVAIIILSLIAAAYAIIQGDVLSQVTLAPLILWLCFALTLNVAEVTTEACTSPPPVV
jgi:tryptophan-rich sensory protein